MGLSSFLAKFVGGSISETAGGVAAAIDRFVETEEEKKAAEVLLTKVQQQPDKWQTEINKIEAAHRSIFVAGWRPFIGWTCGFGLAYHYILRDLMGVIIALSGKVVELPVLNTGELISLVMSLLGLGALRTYEKRSGLTG